jgi:hypothetical protein
MFDCAHSSILNEDIANIFFYLLYKIRDEKGCGLVRNQEKRKTKYELDFINNYN